MASEIDITQQGKLDGWVRLITMVGSMTLSIVFLFVTDPTKQQTIQQVYTALILPSIPLIAGTIFTVARTVTDIKKIDTKKEIALAVISSPPTTVQPSPVAPQTTTAPSTITVTPAVTVSSTPFLVKDRIKSARVMYGTWEGTKALMMGEFKQRFEDSLKRLVRLNPNIKSIDAARSAILEITGTIVDDKACEAIGQQPGMLGAVGANADIKIIGDLLNAIDKTKELGYMKTAFIRVATRYAVKSILDEVTIRVQQGDGNEQSRLALEEFGLTRWQINKSYESSGAGGEFRIWYSTTNQPGTFQLRSFDQYMLAGVDSTTMEDL